MPQIILQPAGNQGSRDHYRDTVASPVPLERITPHLDVATALRLREGFPGGLAAVWGVTPGGRDTNASKWQRISEGDLAVFLRDGRANAVGTVALKTRSASLARELWGSNADGGTWEYLYFLRDVRPTEISYEDLNELLDYDQANRFQGFNVLTDDQSKRALARINDDVGPRKQRVWWVNQGQAYRQQREGQLVWAPKVDKGGRPRETYANVMRLKPGDLLLHYADGIRAIGRVSSEPHEAQRPNNFPPDWGNDGYQANVSYRDLTEALALTRIPQEWRNDEATEPDGPFTRHGSVKLAYLFPLSDRFVERLRGGFPGLLEDGVLEPRQPINMSEKASVDFESAGLLFSADDIARFVASLLTKSFVILTGLAGSGKTKLAQSFAYWVGSLPVNQSCQVVAVGADWTSKDNILGYANALDRQVYERTEALNLILHAKENPDIPHFLILDEMNLSHVERYFADILSSMESGVGIHLHMQPPDLAGVPSDLHLPTNLYVVGTVNVDETTYMFSPKVLDRANVIEFQATRERIGALLADPKAPDLDRLTEQGIQFADFGSRRASTPALPPSARQKLQAEVLLFFDVLAEEGMEFGYRVAFEMEEFLRYHRTLAPHWTFETSFDAQILQKLLPRLHGSQRRIEGILAALASLCYEQRVWEEAELVQLTNASQLRATATEIARQPARDIQRLLATDPGSAQYPLSFSKLRRMLRHVERNGFTSFAEA